ncbi:phosphoinositide-3-kinase-interacting protein 1 [Alosa sapidissima]|uniref:phosphoinositide-3-kinase-interacting protein 1 n=1 Tax=Alosa sapidissima TaxID=34773 RepID=UPI001C094511|nr:phosphoinositide-3-kinase-interacting protein 1 [Alosa sapidissima]
MFFQGYVLLAVVYVTTGSVIPDCIRVHGGQYDGERTISSNGEKCLNWLNVTNAADYTTNNTELWDHSFCRNPDASARPWCFVLVGGDTIQKQDCDIDLCQDQSASATAKTNVDPPPSSGEGQVGRPDASPSQRESVAAKPDPGISRRVRVGPKKKKDLGPLGYVLGGMMMLIIIMLGTGIILGYFYKKGQKLKQQQEQRAYEQEMHRINLPLSAFSNLACQLDDDACSPINHQEKLLEKEKEQERMEEEEDPEGGQRKKSVEAVVQMGVGEGVSNGLDETDASGA